MSKIKKSNWLVPSPRVFVRAALGKVGLGGGAVMRVQGRGGGEGTPYWAHSVVDFVISSIGVNWFVGYTKCTSSFRFFFVSWGGRADLWVLGLATNEQIRKRALRKAEREREKEEVGKKD